MRAALLLLAATAVLTACGDPVAEQARVDTRHDPVRADTMLAVGFRPGTGQLDAGQVNELKAMVAAGRRAQRDEFVVVVDGSGGVLQQRRAQLVKQSLSNAGARWVDTSVEPAMATGPDSVVVVRSEYRIASNNCPNYNPSGMWNPNESTMPGFGCADAYNFGQMLARPRDSAVGRSAGPADATVNADAIQRYREGRVRSANGGGGGSAGGGAAGGGGTSFGVTVGSPTSGATN
ncbi:MAG: CpaD family pilus assembly lipoprotein [Reyranellales bacterium]